MPALRLPAPPAGYAGPQQIVPSTCPVQKDFEASGRAFEEFLYRVLGIEEGDDDDGAAGGSSGKQKEKKKGGEQKKRGLKAAKLTEDELSVDHYETLGLQDLEWNATEDQIKAAYRKLVVLTHPDKTGGDDTQFKAVQKAYEILSDPQKRLAFDSSFEFDDDIPSSKTPVEKFFEEFGDAFHRNSRWSTSRNVPKLGDWETPIEEVQKFYEFWYAFKSWREFSHVDTHNAEEAECRDEKRWMEKENERERRKHQAEENKRIFNLTDRANKLDPRLKKHKEDMARKREEEKQEKEAERKRAQEEKERKAREAKEAEEQRLKEEAEQRKAEQKKRKEETKEVRGICVKCLKPFVSDTVTPTLTDDAVCKPDLEWLFGKLDLEKLQAMHAAMKEIAAKQKAPNKCTVPDLKESCRQDVVAYVNKCITDTEQSTGYNRFGAALKRAKKAGDTTEVATKAAETTAASNAVWTEEELVDLTKAIAKYPGGSFDRWENIAAYVGTKTPDQVLKRTKLMTHQMQDKAPPTKPTIMSQGDKPKEDKQEEKPNLDELWTKKQQGQLEDALKSLKDYKEKDKWDKIAGLVDGKTKKECVERYKYLASMFKKK